MAGSRWSAHLGALHETDGFRIGHVFLGSPASLTGVAVMFGGPVLPFADSGIYR